MKGPVDLPLARFFFRKVILCKHGRAPVCWLWWYTGPSRPGPTENSRVLSRFDKCCTVRSIDRSTDDERPTNDRGCAMRLHFQRLSFVVVKSVPRLPSSCCCCCCCCRPLLEPKQPRDRDDAKKATNPCVYVVQCMWFNVCGSMYVYACVFALLVRCCVVPCALCVCDNRLCLLARLLASLAPLAPLAPIPFCSVVPSLPLTCSCVCARDSFVSSCVSCPFLHPSCRAFSRIPCCCFAHKNEMSTRCLLACLFVA